MISNARRWKSLQADIAIDCVVHVAVLHLLVILKTFVGGVNFAAVLFLANKFWRC